VVRARYERPAHLDLAHRAAVARGVAAGVTAQAQFDQRHRQADHGAATDTLVLGHRSQR
jgi:hypothetical protein